MPLAKKRSKNVPPRIFDVGDAVTVPRYGNSHGTIIGIINRWRQFGTISTLEEMLPHGHMYDVSVEGRPLDSEPLWESELLPAHALGSQIK